MDPLAEARRRQQEKYEKHLAAQAAQKAEQEVAEAAKVKRQRQNFLQQKVSALMQKYSSYTHFDWAATKLQRFFRNRLQSRPSASELVVNVFGDSYPFSVATQLYHVGEAPFDAPEARSIYDAVLRKMQNHEHFGSRDNQLSPDDIILFLLACLCKDSQPDTGLLFGIFDDSIVAHLFSLNLHEHKELSRAIRLLNLLQNQGIPPPIFENLPIGTNLEEIMVSLVQDIQFQLEEIGKSQARLAETFWQPNPDDEVECTNCQVPYLVRDMHTTPHGSFLYCTTCAPLAGIFPQGFFPDDGGELPFPPYPPMPI
jgi:hypothetical protein